ncbi:MAG TPA: hypothetical protein VI306_00640 [Pyrinomonadaceae bacterium]
MRSGPPEKSVLAGLHLLLILLAFTTVKAQTPAYTRSDPPKPEGTVRIGLVTPKVTLLGGTGSATQEVSSLRKNLLSYLTGPRLGTIELKARLDSLAFDESRERNCDYILYTTMTRKRKATGSAGGYGGGTKAGDEFTFEYKIMATDGAQSPVENVLRGTVKTDGEDVLTTMIETAAQSIVNLAKSARPTQTATRPPTSTATPAPVVTAPANSNPEPVSNPPAQTGYGSLTAPLRTRTTTPSTVKDPPKAEGTIRIGMVTPRVSSVGNSDANTLRQTVSSFLQGSTIETIDLKARLDSLALSEGAKRECDYVLYTTLLRKRNAKNSSGGGIDAIFGSMGSGVGSKIPGSKKVKDVSSETAKVGNTIGALTKANDEITFEYTLVLLDGAKTVATKSSKAKVKSDGEDVLTPMIEEAAKTIVNVTEKP